MIEANWRPQPKASLEHVRSLMDVDRLLSTISREGLRSLLQDLRTITAHLRVSDIGAAVTHVPALGIWETLIAASPGAEDSLKKLTRCARLEQNATAYLDNILLSRAYDDFGDDQTINLLLVLWYVFLKKQHVKKLLGCDLR